MPITAMLQDLTELNLRGSFPLTNIMWAVLIVALIIFCIISSILLYHWRTYGLNNKRFVLIETTYFIVSAAIIFLAIISILFSS